MFTITRRRPAGLMAALALALAGCGDEPFTPESSDPCAPGEIAIGGSVSGSIELDACRRGAYPMARWTFELSRETDIRIDLTSSVIDPYLELLTASDVLIAANDDFIGLSSTIITRLSAGRFIIQARDLGGRAGSYRLSLAEGPDCSPRGALELGRSVTGSLSTDACVWETGGHSDNWTLSLAERADLRIEAKSRDFDEVVLIRDQNGSIVNGADDSGPAGFARLDMPMPAGEWTITVGALSPGRTGGYQLTVDRSPPCTPGTELVLGRTESGSIGAEDCRFETYAPADSFALVLDRETPLDFHLKSADMEPFLVVRDAQRRDVVVVGDDHLTGSARMQATLGAGAYAVYAMTFSYPQTGAYQLTVSEVVCPGPTPIAYGTSASGTLGDGDCLRPNGAWYESWMLELDEETTVRIGMVSAAFDAYLILSDDAGDVIAADDDGGNGLDARIEATLAAGRYEIVTTSFHDGQHGAYTLTVDAPPASAAIATSAARFRPGSGVKDDGRWERTDWRDRLVQLSDARLVPAWLSVRK